MQAILHALDEPRRREILRRTWTTELSAGELHRGFGDVTFGAVSQHLRVLSDAGLIECRRAGRHRYYRARHRELGPLRTWLEQMWSQSLADLAALAEDEERRTPSPNQAKPDEGRRRRVAADQRSEGRTENNVRGLALYRDSPRRPAR